MTAAMASAASTAMAGMSHAGSNCRWVMVPRVATGSAFVGTTVTTNGCCRSAPLKKRFSGLATMRMKAAAPGSMVAALVQPEVERLFLVVRRDLDRRGLVAVVVDRELVLAAA